MVQKISKFLKNEHLILKKIILYNINYYIYTHMNMTKLKKYLYQYYINENS